MGDCSHIKDDDECLKSLIGEEPTRDSFTAVVITGINVTHVNYLRTQVKQWTRQLASVTLLFICQRPLISVFAVSYHGKLTTTFLRDRRV